MILLVQEVTSMEKFWIRLGMSNSLDESEASKELIQFVDHLSTKVNLWKKGASNDLSKVPVPSITSARTINILEFQSEREKQLEKELANQKMLHRGFPPLNKGTLEKTVCLYCKKKFNCRDHLFKHLKKMIEPDKMIDSMHQKHFELKVSKSSLNNTTKCPACEHDFGNIDSLHHHLGMLGVSGFWHKNMEKEEEPSKIEQKEEKSIYYDDLCVVCMDAKRDMVCLPCGHVCLCSVCSTLSKSCPICRCEVSQTLKVFFS